MSNLLLPRYPIYIPSKGRWDCCSTAKFLRADDVPFFLVVEPQEREMYAQVFGETNLLTLPFSNPGSVIPARNWIKEHSQKAGALRHWQLDDNIKAIQRRYKSGRRIAVDAGVALRAVEDFSDRYENIAISGLNYRTFVMAVERKTPFILNCRVYSCCLILNSLPHRWRGRYNEDTDMCLQVLADGWCTVLVNAFVIDKAQTMQIKGGNTDTLYHGDGRLKMARSLERLWPGVVEVDRRWNRPQHVVKDRWERFDTPLKLKEGIDLSAIEPNDYGLRLVEVKPVKSESLKRLLDEQKAVSVD